MKELADGVWHLKCLPGMPWAVNAYLVGDVLVDAGCRQSTKRLLKQLDGHEVTAHALTHAHPDHQGASHDVCEQLGISDRTLRRWRTAGILPAIRLGRTVRFRPSDIERALAGSHSNSAADSVP